MGEDPHLLIDRRDGIEIATLNRPESLNMLTRPMTRALVDYFTALQDRPDVRVVILQAKGRAFCAGFDVGGWEKGDKSQISFAFEVQTLLGDIIRRMRACPQPIIALGHGPACGAGFSMLLASDVRYGAPDLRMNAAYIKIGFGGCDIGSSYLLPRLVGRSIASEMLLTGRFIDAQRALRVGLLSDVIPHEHLLDTGLALAEEMLLTSPHGLRLTKRALELNTDAQSMEAAMALEDRQQLLLSTSEDVAEAQQAFFEKRPPRWRDA